MNLKKHLMILFCLLVLVPSQTRSMDARFVSRGAFYVSMVFVGLYVIRAIVKGINQNSSFCYKSNEDGYKYKYCFANYKIFSKKSEKFQKKNDDKVVTLKSLKEILDYVWKLITGKVVDGSGIKANRILQDPAINRVTKINVKDCYVHIVCDPTAQDNMFKIQGDDNILPLINHKVDKNCFYVDNNNFTLHSKNPLVFICTLKRLEEITLSGNSELCRSSQFCNKNICGYCSNTVSADGQRLHANDLTINLSGNACMSAGMRTGEPTIHRNIKANVVGNSSLDIGNCLDAKLIAKDKAGCGFYYPSSLDIELHDGASLSVSGGCNLTGKMFGNSKLSTARYERHYECIKIEFSNQEKQWVSRSFWE